MLYNKKIRNNTYYIERKTNLPVISNATTTVLNKLLPLLQQRPIKDRFVIVRKYFDRANSTAKRKIEYETNVFVFFGMKGICSKIYFQNKYPRKSPYIKKHMILGNT